MFMRHKMMENAMFFSLCGAMYLKQEGVFKDAEKVTVEDAISMLGPVSVGCVCKTDDALQLWVKSKRR
jgi:hypothetical protein